MIDAWPLGSSQDDTIRNIVIDITAFANHNTLRMQSIDEYTFQFDWCDKKICKYLYI